MAPRKPPPAAAGGSERIARRIARAGVCSRRAAEALIAEGRVAVDGHAIASPALNVGPAEIVTVDGEPIPAAEPPRLWRHHKRRGRITTARDPEGRPTVFDDLPAGFPRVITVGRLDYNSEGLLLLTNDGALARTLELPATGWVRRYRVRAHGRVDEPALSRLAGGATVDGVAYGPVEARLERTVGANAWLTVALREGRNREVRKLMAHLGLEVSRLIRVAFGPFQLGNLPPGAVAEVPAKALAEQLGHRLPGLAAPLAPLKPARRKSGAKPHAHRRRAP